jgi:trk system potassium uptake protein TrkH
MATICGIWFGFLKFAEIYSLFMDAGVVSHREFLIVVTVITLIFLGFYIYRTFIQSFKIKTDIRIRPYAMIVLSFISAIFIGTILLFLPVSRAAGAPPLSLVDSLFTATSAVCVTGLIVVDTGTYFSQFGQIVILGLIQIGALGIMTFAGFFTLFLGEKMSLYSKITTRHALNDIGASVTTKFIRAIIFTTFIIEIIGAGLLFIEFRKHFPLGEAIYTSVFHSISAFCNAGFSIYSDSVTAFVSNPLINIVMMLLIIIGGLGFFVILNVLNVIKKKKRRISLHTRIVVMTSIFLVIIGAVVFFLLEYNNILAEKSIGESVLVSFFSSVTTRTAGFNTVDFSSAKGVTLFFIVVLMFIGASPGSTGGGIKTTTFTTIALTAYNTLRGRPMVRFFGREFPVKVIRKAIVMFFISITWVTVISIVIGSIEDFDMMRVLFETVSAFGTVGLSTGITSDLSNLSKILITITMFAGRVGFFTLMLSLGFEKRTEIRRPEEKVIIG